MKKKAEVNRLTKSMSQIQLTIIFLFFGFLSIGQCSNEEESFVYRWSKDSIAILSYQNEVHSNCDSAYLKGKQFLCEKSLFTVDGKIQLEGVFDGAGQNLWNGNWYLYDELGNLLGIEKYTLGCYSGDSTITYTVSESYADSVNYSLHIKIFKLYNSEPELVDQMTFSYSNNYSTVTYFEQKNSDSSSQTIDLSRNLINEIISFEYDSNEIGCGSDDCSLYIEFDDGQTQKKYWLNKENSTALKNWILELK